MQEADFKELFVRQLTENQNRLYGYVYSLIGNHSRAADIVQETNLVLWRKLDEFHPDKPFLPWAFACARFQVLANVRDKKRDRMLLDEGLVQSLSDEVETQSGKIDAVREALRPCLQLLTANNRELIERRYFRTMAIADISAELDRTVNAVKVALMRTRRQLADCVQQRLAKAGEQ